MTTRVMWELCPLASQPVRRIAKFARKRNRDVCTLLREAVEIGGRIACKGALFRVLHDHKGYQRTSTMCGPRLWGNQSIDLSTEFADVIAEVENDSGFGLFLGMECAE